MADMATFNNIWTKLGGRKLIALVLGIGATILLAFFDKIDGNVVTLILGLTGAFTGGNVVEHVMSARKAVAQVQGAISAPQTKEVSEPMPEPEPKNMD